MLRQRRRRVLRLEGRSLLLGFEKGKVEIEEKDGENGEMMKMMKMMR